MDKRLFILTATLTAFRLFAQPTLPTTNYMLAPIANSYSGSWIYYTTNPASGLGFLNGASISAVMAVSNSVVAYVNAATNGLVGTGITNGLATTNFVLSQGYVTGSVTNGLATVGYVNTATNGLATTGFVTGQGYVTASITNGLATVSYVNAATNGLASYSTLTNQILGTNAALIALINASGVNGTNFTRATAIALTNQITATSNLVYQAGTNFVLSQGYVTVKTVWSGSSGSQQVNGNSTRYEPPNSSATPFNSYVDGQTGVPVPEDMTLTNFYVFIQVATGGTDAAHTSTVTILTNGVASPLAVAVSGTGTTQAARTFSNTTDSVTVPAGTVIGLKFVTGNSAPNSAYSWSFQGH